MQNFFGEDFVAVKILGKAENSELAESECQKNLFEETLERFKSAMML